jgi:gliding motility-associated-like protein
VTAEVVVFNAVSPNNDQKNDFFFIRYINPSENKVTIYNRWGDQVFEMEQYDNTESTRRFEGRNNNGTILPSGTYFYKIELRTGEVINGYLSLKH